MKQWSSALISSFEEYTTDSKLYCKGILNAYFVYTKISTDQAIENF